MLPLSLSLLPCGFSSSSQANLGILATKPGRACALPRGSAPPLPAQISALRCDRGDEPGEEAGAGRADPSHLPNNGPTASPQPPSRSGSIPAALPPHALVYSQYVFLVSSSTTSGFNLLLDFPMVAGSAVSPGRAASRPHCGGMEGRGGLGGSSRPGYIPRRGRAARPGGERGGWVSLLPGFGRKGERRGRPVCAIVCVRGPGYTHPPRPLPPGAERPRARCGGAEGR